ncbi:DUF3347 domain-containing protein [Chitinophaga sp. GCM10012297]|uniref:DUF3347 domain-containing protein n=1 Tax=Chitinophaga chungangae TaxID=2821488 RepID=A0ABS3YHU3_9BACT|nr:DUF3347 domain-containing protein [Chitinophaga chungangae]MBO9154261.1 DUF3347 domain-containing protein [Chitinophaga chungangae]
MRIKPYLWALAVGVALTACQQGARQQSSGDSALAAGALGAPFSDEYYDSLKTAMTAYYQLSGALIKGDTLGADVAAASLKTHLDSLPIARLGIDSSRAANLAVSTGNISAELAGLLIEKGGLDARRLSFQMVSDQLYDLLQTTGFKGHAIYRQHCPMAFNNRGAHWLSDTTEVVNPYFGDEMLHCGSVTDTLRFQ